MFEKFYTNEATAQDGHDYLKTFIQEAFSNKYFCCEFNGKLDAYKTKASAIKRRDVLIAKYCLVETTEEV